MSKKNTNKGFTLIELLLYISISAIILLTISFLLFTILQSRIKNQTVADVEMQGIGAMQIITQTIRNAEGINSPTKSSSSTSISIDVVDASKDPTIFDISAGVLRITEGTGSALPLTGSTVLVSDVDFGNFSPLGTNDLIRTEFTISHVNPEGRNEYDYQKTFYSSSVVRQ